MSPKATAAASEASGEVRLASLHLRVGMLVLALAELEDLERQGLLGGPERALLAEARWRSGDAEGATTAARDHLDAGGSDPVALCIAAEAAAADGRPGEARALMDRLGPPDAATLEVLFAGMPRRAFWPSAPVEATEPETLFAELGRADESRRAAGIAPMPAAAGESPAAPRARSSAVPGPRDVLDAEGLWSADAAAIAGGEDTSEDAVDREAVARRPRHVTPSLEQDPVAELARARVELSTDPDRALLRLGLTLRLDPTLAPAVLDVIALRPEPAAALLRGDAQRLLGRHLEAEAAYAEAAGGLTELPAVSAGGPPKPRS